MRILAVCAVLLLAGCSGPSDEPVDDVLQEPVVQDVVETFSATVGWDQKVWGDAAGVSSNMEFQGRQSGGFSVHDNVTSMGATIVGTIMYSCAGACDLAVHLVRQGGIAETFTGTSPLSYEVEGLLAGDYWFDAVPLGTGMTPGISMNTDVTIAGDLVYQTEDVTEAPEGPNRPT